MSRDSNVTSFLVLLVTYEKDNRPEIVRLTVCEIINNQTLYIMEHLFN